MATWEYGPRIFVEPADGYNPEFRTELKMEYSTSADQMVIYHNGKDVLRLGEEEAKWLAEQMKNWFESY